MTEIETPLPPVSVIVLNYNGREFVRACLNSIRAQVYPDFEVLFVDNGSTDGSAELVSEEYPWVKLIVSPKNLGFAGGNNLGVERASHDLVVLVNNDVVVQDGWLAELVAAISEPNVGIASSLCHTDGMPKLFYARNGTLNLLGQNIMLAFEKPEDIFYASGCSMIFRKSDIGLPFDADYFAYSEDVHLGFRVRFSGKLVRHTNKSFLLHFGGGTAKKQASAFVTFYQERNRLLNLLLFFGPGTRLKLIPYFLFNSVAKTGYGILKNRRGLSGVWKAYWWLVSHPRVISKKRRELAAQRLIDEKQVLKVMSCRLLDSESGGAKFINGMSKLYCTIVGIRTQEHFPTSPLLEKLRSDMSDPAVMNERIDLTDLRQSLNRVPNVE